MRQAQLYVWGPLSRVWMPIVRGDLQERANYRNAGVCTCWVKQCE